MQHEDLLVEFAAGALSPAASLLVATQAGLRPDVRASLADLDAVGGALLSRSDAAAPEEGALERVLERIDQESGSPLPAAGDGRPAALRDFFGGTLTADKWRTLIPGMRYAAIPEFTTPDCLTRLVSLKAGRAIPRHTHKGMELTLVLSGGYEDETGRFDVGDVAIADPEIEHQPRVDDDADCICLTVEEGGMLIRRPIVEFVRYFLQ
ncbi:MAG: ChrR family anti-sigma-E factor [Maricaulaceae bacterium]